MANTPFHTPALTKDQWVTQRNLLVGLYQRLRTPDGEEFEYSLERLRAEFPDTVNPDKAVLVFEQAGVLERRMDRGNGHAPKSLWKLPVVDPAAAQQQLTDYQERIEQERIERNVAERDSGARAARGLHRKKPKPTIGPRGYERVAKVEERPAVTESEAIVGPEPTNAFAALAPLRKNEAAALVEAARQYATRDTTVSTQLDQMEAAMKAIGVTFDRSAVQDAVTIERDERLETVALVLPYINRLEHDFVRVTDELAQARGKLAEMPEMKQGLQSQRRQIERLIAERDAFRRRD